MLECLPDAVEFLSVWSLLSADQKAELLRMAKAMRGRSLLERIVGTVYGLSVATVGRGPVFVCLFVERFYGASSSSSPVLGFRAYEECKLFMVLHTLLSPCFLQFVSFYIPLRMRVLYTFRPLVW